MLLAAHMDEVGLIVTRITEKGYLKFSFVGGVDRRVALGKRVVLGPNQVKGVIGIKAIHLFQRKDEEIIPDMDSDEPGGRGHHAAVHPPPLYAHAG